MNEATSLLFYMVSTHLLVEYAGPWRTLRDDFVFRGFLWRASLFLALSLAWLLPWISVGGMAVLLGLVVGRETLRWLLSRGPKLLEASPLATPAFELGAHLALILGWLWIYDLCMPAQPVRLDTWASFFASPRAIQGVAFAAGLAFAIGGGTVFIRGLLAQAGKSPSESDSTRSPTLAEYGVGRLIGDLERTLIFLMALEGQLDAAGLVLAAKSLARFKEFDDRDFAEYYLLGTLSSTLWAIFVARAVLFITSLS